jgi:hypothetical protein
VSAAWSKSITFPKDMRSKGTMLVNGLPCPTHHVVDEEQGFFVSVGEPFWSRVLELLSSRPNDSQPTDFNPMLVSTFQHTCFSSVRVL